MNAQRTQASRRVASAAVCSALLSALLIGGCDLRPPPLTAWVADDMLALTSRTPPTIGRDVFDADRRAVLVHAAGNETVSFQLVIDAGDRAIRGFSLAWTALTSEAGGTIGKSNISAFRGKAVRVTRYPPWYLRLVDETPEPAEFYDALIPLPPTAEDQPPPTIDVARGGRLALWIDVRVPRGARAGEYSGTITLESSTHAPWSAGLELTVHDFVLPDARPVIAAGGIDHADLFALMVREKGEPALPARLDRTRPRIRRGLAVLRELMRTAHRHRLDLFDTRIRPGLKRDSAGRVKLAWDDYDAIVMPYLDGTAFDDRLACPAWPVPFSDGFPPPAPYGGLDSEAYATTAGGLVTDCREHFASMPAANERMFLWPYRGPVTEEAYGSSLRLARIARAADAETPLLCRLPLKPPATTGWTVPGGLADLVDASAPPGEWLDPSAARAAAMHPLKGTWLSPGKPPYVPSLGVLASPADVRAFPWFALKYRCAGLLLADVLHWGGAETADREALFAAEGSAQTRLFYPGQNTPLASVRLKRLRRGLQDLAYLSILRQRGRAEIANSIIDGMVRYAGLDAAGDNYLDPRLDGWAQSGAAWRQMRRLLAAEVLDAIHPEKAEGQRLLEQRLAWQTFDENVHQVRVEQVRSRVEPASVGDGRIESLEMTVLLDLYNEYGRAVELSARLEGLPPGWQTGDPVRPSPFSPRQRRTVRIRATGRQVPATADAKIDASVVLAVDRDPPRQIDAAVPFLLVGRAAETPRIDGVLDDWPMRAGNTAGNFRLVGRRGRGGQARGGPAKRQTQVFVVQDERNLYVAFRCESPGSTPLTARSDTLVRYEQLMAHGEDLVEAILDPGGDAAGPEDLFHILVKANGVLITDRGVHSDPPLGPWRPWSAGAAAAVGITRDAWTVELAIPRSAFGEEGAAKFWGVNFARFAPGGAEASSWSGAPRYFYDARNLGTMFFTPTAGP